VRLKGALDAGVLAACLGEVVRRHEVLRTTFSQVESRTVPTVHPARQTLLPLGDLISLDGEVRELAVCRAVEAAAELPFDLARGPLLRASLLRLGAEDHALVVTAHPLVSDAWSLRLVLLRELLALYDAFLEGRPSPLPELSVQYGDFAAWQHRSLCGPRVEAHLARWRRALEGAPLALAAPAEPPRPSTSTFRGGAVRRLLPADLTATLRRMSSEERVTLSITLLAACGVVIHHWTSASDVVAGVDHASRDQVETQELIGAFADPLAVRIHVRGDASFRELLRQARDATLDAYQFQDVPFVKLSEAPSSEGVAAPLFRLRIGVYRFPPIAPWQRGPAIASVVLDDPAAPHELSFRFEDGESGVVAALLYDRGRFVDATIEGLLGRLETVLSEAGATPDTRLAEIEEQLDSRAEHRKERERQLEEARSSLFKGIRQLSGRKSK
jgi:condensation domain-containing protein